MTRIVGGSAGGRRIAAPPGRLTRPTAERTREALFASLGTLLELPGARVLDLYAGSGALGLEALSRGAAEAVLVDSDPRAVRSIRDNATTLDFSTAARVVRDRVERYILRDSPDPVGFDLVLADPPYALPGTEVSAVLGTLLRGGWLAPGCVVAVERPSRALPFTWPTGLEPVRHRRYGEGTLWYGRRP